MKFTYIIFKNTLIFDFRFKTVFNNDFFLRKCTSSKEVVQVRSLQFILLYKMYIHIYIHIYIYIKYVRNILSFFDQHSQYNLKYHMYGHEKELPDRSISLIRVSMGVFPTSLTKNNCSITAELTVRKLGKRNNNLPNLVG